MCHSASLTTLHCGEIFNIYNAVFTRRVFSIHTRMSMLISTRLYFSSTAWHGNDIEQNKNTHENILHGIHVVVC